MKLWYLTVVLLLVVLSACNETSTLPVVSTATPAPPSTPASRMVVPTGEPGTARIHEPGWQTPLELAFNDDGWEDSPYITRDGSRILFFYYIVQHVMNSGSIAPAMPTSVSCAMLWQAGFRRPSHSRLIQSMPTILTAFRIHANTLDG
nr:hypothetical protein [Ardenticatena sp.]